MDVSETPGPSSPLLLSTAVNGRGIEVACYGEGTHWLCRLTDPSLQPRGPQCDAYYPPPEIGFLWLREHEGMCLVSGTVSNVLFRTPGSVFDVVEFILRQLHWDSQPSIRVELVGVTQTYTFDGERGPEFW